MKTHVEHARGWRRVLKVTLAVAHSGAVLFATFSLLEFLRVAAGPGPRDPMFGLGGAYIYLFLLVLGLPWSAALSLMYLVVPAVYSWAMAHSFWDLGRAHPDRGPE